jgi:hypothetical protein
MANAVQNVIGEIVYEWDGKSMNLLEAIVDANAELEQKLLEQQYRGFQLSSLIANNRDNGHGNSKFLSMLSACISSRTYSGPVKVPSQKSAAMTNHFAQEIARKNGLKQCIRVICKKLDEAIQGEAQTHPDLLDEEIAEEGTEIGEWRMVARLMHLSSKEMRLCNGPMYEAALHASCLYGMWTLLYHQGEAGTDEQREAMRRIVNRECDEPGGIKSSLRDVQVHVYVSAFSSM